MDEQEKIVSGFEKMEAEIVSILKRLVRIPSLTGEEGSAQSFLASHLERYAGLEIVI